MNFCQCLQIKTKRRRRGKNIKNKKKIHLNLLTKFIELFPQIIENLKHFRLKRINFRLGL